MKQSFDDYVVGPIAQGSITVTGASSAGSVVVTNDGVTILKEMDIEHPAANMIVEVAQTQEDEVGDGTTSAVVVAGELNKQAEDLLDQAYEDEEVTS